jgi:hypothetical protein
VSSRGEHVAAYTPTPEDALAWVQGAQVEIDRLRTALTEIADFDESEWHESDGFLAVSFLCAKAKEALNG